MKILFTLLLLIPSLSWGKEINLNCQMLYTDSIDNGKLSKKYDDKKSFFLKIDNNKFYFSGEEYGSTINKTTDDYYYIFDKKDSYWKNYLFDVLQGIDGGNNNQYRINRKTGVLEIWTVVSKKLKFGFKSFYQCELVKNKF